MREGPPEQQEWAAGESEQQEKQQENKTKQLAQADILSVALENFGVVIVQLPPCQLLRRNPACLDRCLPLRRRRRRLLGRGALAVQPCLELGWRQLGTLLLRLLLLLLLRLSRLGCVLSRLLSGRVGRQGNGHGCHAEGKQHGRRWHAKRLEAFGTASVALQR